jgi:hypothetical protein
MSYTCTFVVVVVSCVILASFCRGSSDREFGGGKKHSFHDDHVAFLGDEMAKEFETLTPEEAKRRLR